MDDIHSFHFNLIVSLFFFRLLFFVNEYLTNTAQGFDSIESITMGGTELRSLKDFLKRYPTSEHDGQYDITVDHAGERLYYLHRANKVIESVSITGR